MANEIHAAGMNSVTQTQLPNGCDDLDFTRRIPQLDGVRGVAIVTVLVFHYVAFAVQVGAPPVVALLLPPLTLGWAGVDLFFVLSGFLIGGILLDARGSNNYFQAFYKRRVCRIFPLYIAFLAVAAIASVVLASPAIVPWNFSFVFLQNFWMAAHNSLGGAIIDPTWSLAVEEQFYLTLPALIYFVSPRQLPKVLLGGILIAPVIRVGLYLSWSGSATATFVLLPCRMDSLLIGVMTAYLLRRPHAGDLLRSCKRKLWLAIELFTLISSLFYLFGRRDNLLTNLLIYDSLAVLFACLIAASFVDETLSRALQTKWLMGLGTIAYGVYLIHPLMFAFTAFLLPAGPRRGSIAAAVAAILTVAMAKLSWVYFERPIIKLGHRATYTRAHIHSTAPARSVLMTE